MLSMLRLFVQREGDGECRSQIAQPRLFQRSNVVGEDCLWKADKFIAVDAGVFLQSFSGAYGNLCAQAIVPRVNRRTNHG